MGRVLFVVLALAVLLVGCSGGPPACDAPEVKEQLRNTLLDIVGKTGLYAKCYEPVGGAAARPVTGRQLAYLIEAAGDKCGEGQAEYCKVMACLVDLTSPDDYTIAEVEDFGDMRLCVLTMPGGDVRFQYKLRKAGSGFSYEPVE